jgi:hypothetical protein
MNLDFKNIINEISNEILTNVNHKIQQEITDIKNETNNNINKLKKSIDKVSINKKNIHKKVLEDIGDIEKKIIKSIKKDLNKEDKNKNPILKDINPEFKDLFVQKIDLIRETNNNEIKESLKKTKNMLVLHNQKILDDANKNFKIQHQKAEKSYLIELEDRIDKMYHKYFDSVTNTNKIDTIIKSHVKKYVESTLLEDYTQKQLQRAYDFSEINDENYKLNLINIVKGFIDINYDKFYNKESNNMHSNTILNVYNISKDLYEIPKFEVEEPITNENIYVVIRGETFRNITNKRILYKQMDSIKKIYEHVIKPIKTKYINSTIKILFIVPEKDLNNQIINYFKKYDIEIISYQYKNHYPTQIKSFQHALNITDNHIKTDLEKDNKSLGFVLFIRPDIYFRQNLSFDNADKNKVLFVWNIFMRKLKKSVPDQIQFVGGNMFHKFKDIICNYYIKGNNLHKLYIIFLVFFKFHNLSYMNFVDDPAPEFDYTVIKENSNHNIIGIYPTFIYENHYEDPNVLKEEFIKKDTNIFNNIYMPQKRYKMLPLRLRKRIIKRYKEQVLFSIDLTKDDIQKYKDIRQQEFAILKTFIDIDSVLLPHIFDDLLLEDDKYNYSEH